MFTEYREILKVVCSSAWDTAKCQEQMETILCNIEENSDYCLDSKGFVLMNLLKKLCLIAFQGKDRDLFNLVIMTLIDLDEVMDDIRDEMDEAFARVAREKVPEQKKEEPPEQKKDREAETEAVAGEGRRKESEEIKSEEAKPPLEEIERPSKDEDETLDNEYNVRKKILDYILANVSGDAFSINDIQAILRGYYNDVLKKPKTKDSTLQVYSNSYARHIVEKNLATKDEFEGALAHERSVKRFHLVKRKAEVIAEKMFTVVEEAEEPGKTDRLSLSKQAQYILLWAEKNTTDIVEAEAIFTHSLDGSVKQYSEKALLRAFDEMEKKGVAKKLTKGKYIVRRKMIC